MGCEVFYTSLGFLTSFQYASNHPSLQDLVTCYGFSLMANLFWRGFELLYMEEIVKYISYLDSWNICALCEDQDCESYGRVTFFEVS